MRQKEDLVHQCVQSLSNSHNITGRLTIILISVLLLTTAGVGGYMLGARRQQPSPTGLLTNPDPSRLPTATPIQQLSPHPTNTTSQTDPTAGWKVYRDEKYRYSIKYPHGWIIAITNNGSQGTPHYVALTDSALSKSSLAPVLSIHVKPNSPYPEELRYAKASIGADEERDVIVANIEGKKYSSSGIVAGPGPQLVAFVLPFNSGTFLIIATPEQESREYSATIQRIVSTLNFVN